MKTIEISPGSHIDAAISHAIGTARAEGSPCRFDFNGVTVTVDGESNQEHVLRDWRRAFDGKISKAIGVVYADKLTEEEIASDARIEAENEARRKRDREAYEARQKSKRERIDSILEGAAELQLIDTDQANQVIDKNRDPYGAATLRYATRLGRLMQVEIAAGSSVADAFAKWKYEADDDGMSGAMAGFARAFLRRFWIHGKELP